MLTSIKYQSRSCPLPNETMLGAVIVKRGVDDPVIDEPAMSSTVAHGLVDWLVRRPVAGSTTSHTLWKRRGRAFFQYFARKGMSLNAPARVVPSGPSWFPARLSGFGPSKGNKFRMRQPWTHSMNTSP